MAANTEECQTNKCGVGYFGVFCKGNSRRKKNLNQQESSVDKLKVILVKGSGPYKSC